MKSLEILLIFCPDVYMNVCHEEGYYHVTVETPHNFQITSTSQRLSEALEEAICKSLEIIAKEKTNSSNDQP
jgi:hypothetical protein